MKERLQRILTKEGIAPTRFAEIIGVQRSSISHILSGRNKPSFDMIQSIMSKFPKLNPDWLILGTGDMYRKVVQTTLFADPDTSKEASSPSTSPQHNIDTRKEQQVKPSENSIFEKRVERVIVFYNDRTFTEYSPQ
jgi:transcriptional regulator with XRE-family HTH domain